MLRKSLRRSASDSLSASAIRLAGVCFAGLLTGASSSPCTHFPEATPKKPCAPVAEEVVRKIDRNGCKGKGACAAKNSCRPSIQISDFTPGWCFLEHGKTEQRLVGAHTYLLLSVEEKGERRLQVLSVLERILRVISPQVELLDKPSMLNAFEFPVKVGMLPATVVTHADKARWILDNYDYARARSMMRALREYSPTAPPLLFCSLEPLSNRTTPPQTAVLRATLELDDDDTLLPIVDRFVSKSTTISEWNEKHIGEVFLDVRQLANEMASSGKNIPASVISILTFTKKLGK